MRRGLLLSALAAAALAWAAGPAGAQIVVNRSIAGVAPGMTRQAAEAKLGQPKVTWAYDSRGNLVPGVIGGGEPYVTMRYGRGVMLSFAASVVPRGRCPYPATAARKDRARLEAWVRCALRLVPAGARVEQIDALTAAERTVSRVGVGSSFAAAKRGLSGAECRQGRGRSLCFFLPAAPSRTQTRFLFDARGRVTAVEIQGYGACRPADGCTSGAGDGGGGKPKPKPGPPLRVDRVECTPSPFSMSSGAQVECGVWESGVNPETDVAKIEYDWGDGSPISEYWGHQYAQPGTYTVRGIVTTKDGRTATGSVVLVVTA